MGEDMEVDIDGHEQKHKSGPRILPNSDTQVLLAASYNICSVIDPSLTLQRNIVQ